MALEIERKFLVADNSFKAESVESHNICQGYLSRDPTRTVRIRIRDSKGFITVKGVTVGCVREEFEYEIPYEDAERLLALCQPPVLKKVRYIVPFGGFRWEIDEFLSREDGLILAEVELPDAEATVELPPFVGEEVTGNPAYYNSNL